MSEIYKYLDEYGNTHFTDDFSKVPIEQRPSVDTSVEYKNDTDREQVTDSEASHAIGNDITDESYEKAEEFVDDSENQDEMVDSSEEADEEQIVALDQDTDNEADLLATFDEAQPEKDLDAIRNQLEVLKKEIDGEYQDLIREKEQLAKEKKSLIGRAGILEHNKKVRRLNKNVEIYAKKAKKYETRVEAYNERVRQENAKAKEKAETQ
jgi:hypothetical protein